MTLKKTKPIYDLRCMIGRRTAYDLKINRFIISLFIIHCSLFITSCGIYSFSGTSINYEKIKTLTITNFVMATAGGPANLPLKLNENLKEYYQRNTSLKLLPSNGDVQLEGSIVGYEVSPVAPTSQDQSAFNRLTMTVQVKFTNTKEEDKDFEQSFSFYQDFPANQTLNQNEARLIEKILEQIVQDIFNKTAADW